MQTKSEKTKLLCFALISLIAILIISGIQPYDRATWVMEVLPVMIVLPILIISYKHFPLTPILYGLIYLHAIVLIVGGCYTYARVPFGFELANLFDLQRNPYDKIGHFLQGFVPALAARELLIRHQFVQHKKMLVFIVICITLAISAVYELIEWAAALIMGQGADEFLGTQGDVWDTQSDMFFALIGAIGALSLLARLQDKQIQNM
jgi:putative membrane protein